MDRSQVYLLRYQAAKEMVNEVRAAGGYRLAMDIGTGAVYLWHGTSMANAQDIIKTKHFKADSYFSHARDHACFGSGGAADYAFMRGHRTGAGSVMRIKIDARDINFSQSTGEFDSEWNLYMGDDGVWASKDHMVKWETNPRLHFDPHRSGSNWDSVADQITIGTKPEGGPLTKEEEVPQILGHEIGHHQLGHKNQSDDKQPWLIFIHEVKAWNWILNKTHAVGYNPALVARCLESYTLDLTQSQKSKASTRISNLVRKYFGKATAERTLFGVGFSRLFRNPEHKEPWKMMPDEFHAFADTGKIHTATNTWNAKERELSGRRSFSAIEFGEAAGYSAADIAHFYLERNPYLGYFQYMTDAIRLGRDVPDSIIEYIFIPKAVNKWKRLRDKYRKNPEDFEKIQFGIRREYPNIDRLHLTLNKVSQEGWYGKRYNMTTESKPTNRLPLQRMKAMRAWDVNREVVVDTSLVDYIPGGDGERDRVIIKDPRYTSVPEFKSLNGPRSDKYLYRGMSGEEWEDILYYNRIQTKGDYNFSSQQGLTYFTTDPAQAEHYADGFAPWTYMATWRHPAVVIRIKRPQESRLVYTKENLPEVGVRGPLPFEYIDAVYELRVAVEYPGDMDWSLRGVLVESGSRSPQSHFLVARQVPKGEWWDFISSRRNPQRNPDIYIMPDEKKIEAHMSLIALSLSKGVLKEPVVIAHEIAHWKLGHIQKDLLIQERNWRQIQPEPFLVYQFGQELDAWDWALARQRDHSVRKNLVWACIASYVNTGLPYSVRSRLYHMIDNLTVRYYRKFK